MTPLLRYDHRYSWLADREAVDHRIVLWHQQLNRMHDAEEHQYRLDVRIDDELEGEVAC